MPNSRYTKVCERFVPFVMLPKQCVNCGHTLRKHQIEAAKRKRESEVNRESPR